MTETQNSFRWQKRLALVASLFLALAFCPAMRAAEEPTKAPSGGSGGGKKSKIKPTVTERPQVIGFSFDTSGTDSTKPARPDSGTETSETARLITQFQAAREQFLETQKELTLKMKDATEEQRAVLREQAKEALDRWREEHRHFVEEQKERARQIKQELHPDLGNVVDGAGGGSGGGRGR